MTGTSPKSDCKKILVTVATYNEIDNVEELIRQIFSNLPEAEILFVDDASPDGTGHLLDQLSSKNPKIHVVHRPGKMGLGTACLLTFKYAIAYEFDYLISMDADFSHDPKHLPQMVGLLGEHEFITGSRWMEGGKCDYSLGRKMLSVTANLCARYSLGLKLHEVTTYFRGYKVSLLKKLELDSIHAEGYSFAVELVYRITQITDKVVEFPISFRDRQAGVSKISKIEVYRGVLTLLKLFIGRLLFVSPLREKIASAEKRTAPQCPVCKSTFHREVYPEKKIEGVSDENSAYRCSSLEHNAHGRILRCLRCGLIFSEANFTSEEMAKVYSEVEDPVYAQEINARFKTYKYNLDKIKPYLPAGGTLLDVGSYCGAFLKVAGENGFKATGVEPSKWAVKYARKVMKENTFQGTLKDLPRDAGNFDVVTMWDVLEHMVDPLQELKLIRSRLNSRAIFCFSTIMIDHWYPQMLKERWPWLMNMHVLYFSKKSLANLLKESGFQLVASRKYCHYVSLGYLFSKLESLGIPGARFLRSLINATPLRRMLVPFSLGDIQLFVCQKTD